MSISSAFSLPCTASTGGLVNIWLSDRDNITSFTLSGDEYNNVTMTSSNVFYKYEFEQDTAALRNNASRESRSASIVHEVEFYLTKMTTTQRNALQAIVESSTCGLVAICEDANGQKWVVGYSENFLLVRPLKMQTIEGTTGAAFTDDNGDTVIIASSDNEYPRVFTGTVPV